MAHDRLWRSSHIYNIEDTKFLPRFGPFFISICPRIGWIRLDRTTIPPCKAQAVFFLIGDITTCLEGDIASCLVGNVASSLVGDSISARSIGPV